jgi:hypothetical protein
MVSPIDVHFDCLEIEEMNEELQGFRHVTIVAGDITSPRNACPVDLTR